MSYATATPAQQAQVNNFVLMLRSTIIRLWQLNNNVDALVLDWNANILGILGSPTGIPILDGTNLAGAVQMTDTQVTQLFGILETFQTDIMTAGNETAFMLATGPNNSTGT